MKKNITRQISQIVCNRKHFLELKDALITQIFVQTNITDK